MPEFSYFLDYQEIFAKETCYNSIAAHGYIALLPVCLKSPGYFTFAEVLLCDLLEVMHFFLHLFHTTNNMGSKNHLA